MKNAIKRIIAVTLSSSMVLALAACSSEKSKDNSKQSYFGQVWSAPSTIKVAQDDTGYAAKGEAALTYKAVRNEYESCQLLITADKEVTGYKLQAVDLKNGEHTLSKENITVYMQKYVTFSDYYGDNLSMPDALIPMDSAVEYKENVIEKGKNGALWITVYVPKDSVAGVYEGTFQLELKGDKKEEIVEIPVSVDVYDYTLTDELNASTLFSWRYDRVAAGELDASNKMMTTYYEFFKNYRISLQSMPLEGLTGEEFAENVLKYYDQISTYSLLKVVGDISIGVQDSQYLIEEILAIAEVCPEDKNLFDKAMVYPQDEPNLTENSAREGVIASMNRCRAAFEKCVQLIKEDTTGKYDTFKSREDWEACIRNITIIIPTDVRSITWLLQNQNTEEGKTVLAAYDCLCPYFTEMTDGRREAIIKMCEENDVRLWWYGCTEPKGPAPNYHIGDTNLLSARTVSWLQYAYDIEGNLYWDAAAYTDEDTSVYNQYINVYETPFHSLYRTWPAGDGFLAYPGAAYGIYGPLPSLRLMSIRDGMEEYELLREVEAVLESQATTFGADFSIEEAMNGFYEPLCYDVSRMNADGQQGFHFEAVRTNLLNTLVSLNKGTALLIAGATYQDDILTITYYAQQDTTITIDGKEQQPVSGEKYQYSVNYQEVPKVEFVAKNQKGQQETYVYYAQSPIELLNGFTENSAVEFVKASEGSKVEFVVDSDGTIAASDDKTIKCNVNGVVTGDVLVDAGFHPTISINLKDSIDVKLTELETLYVNFIVPSDSIDVSVSFCAGTKKYSVGSYTLPNGPYALALDLEQMNQETLEDIDSILFEFNNLSNEEAVSYEFYLDGISGQRPYEGGK